MAMVKLVGTILLIAVSVSCGVMAAGGLRQRLTALRQLRRMLEALRLMIRYEALEVVQMTARLADDETLTELEFIPYINQYAASAVETGGESFAEAWHRAVDEHCGSFSKEDIPLIMRTGSVLGVCDCEGQLQSLAACCAECDRLIDEAQGQYQAKGRLYRALGAVAGALIAVVVI